MRKDRPSAPQRYPRCGLKSDETAESLPAHARVNGKNDASAARACCQPRCSGKLANGKREFATSIFTTVSADARVIAHLCQSLHCCAAPHEATAKGVGVLTHRGRHGLRCPTRALFTSVSGGIIIHNTGKPRTRRRLPCADHHADERVLLLHSSAVRGRLAGSVQGHVLDAPGRCEVRTAPCLRSHRHPSSLRGCPDRVSRFSQTTP